MLIVGLGVLSPEEEKFHFGMWALHKSPLVIGAPLGDDDGALLPAASLAVLANPDVIAINQDPLGRQARLVRRDTTAQWDVWFGSLSDDRVVLGLANWANDSQVVTVSLPADLGLASAASARDAWAGEDLGPLAGGDYTITLAGHELRLLVLSAVVAATAGVPTSTGAYYAAARDATLSGAAAVVACPSPSAQCLPVGSKVGNIGQGRGAAAVTFANVTAASAGTKLLGIDFIHYDVALASAWDLGDNTRNMTIAVNQPEGGGTRFAFPLSGGDWYDSDRLYVYVDNFVAGDDNEVVFTAYGDDATWAPDLVGFEVFEVSS